MAKKTKHADKRREKEESNYNKLEKFLANRNGGNNVKSNSTEPKRDSQ